MTTRPHAPHSIPAGAPFLVWPVARREFYLAIQIALLPALVWGAVIFGWRVLIMLLAADLAASVLHFLLKRFTARGKSLVYAHTTCAVLVLVALAHPMWPLWIVTVAAATIPIAFFILGGPGRERIHIAVAWLLLLQLVVLPAIFNSPASLGRHDAILARDRLLMGDIRNTRPAPLYRWESSLDLGGNDAIRMPRPQFVAYNSLNNLSLDLRNLPRPKPAAETSAAPAPRPSALPLTTRHMLRISLDETLSTQFPAVELLMAGAVPGRIAVVSPLAIVLGGLFLAYRYILRPRSVAIFLLTYLLAMGLLVFWPTTIAHVGLRTIYATCRAFPGEILTLLEYAFFNGDALFATIFILALPGTVPLTNRGRRVFLITAAIAAATLDRLNLNLPAASTTLALLMPAAPLFDRLFAKRSWLNRRF